MSICDVGVINDIMRALAPIHNDHRTEWVNAARRGVPLSQFIDECPQLDTKLIRHRASHRGHDRPCYATLHLSTIKVLHITRVDWSAINNSPNFPFHSDPFRSLNDIYLNFPASTQHNCPKHNPPSQNNTDALRFTVEATGIHGLTATNTDTQGNSITIKSEHRNVQVNLAGLHGISLNINFIAGDNFSGAISSSNIGGTNNVNTIPISSLVGSSSPRLASSLPRSRHTLPQPEQAESQGGVYLGTSALALPAAISKYTPAQLDTSTIL
ncbi:hypothetical protein EYR36_001881 [Pleurotus pulmonarius]|nr:hypothetical protein EYR36_001881 [Pleurotus pulmonarius]